MEVEAAKLIAGGIALLPGFGAAIGLGLYFKGYVEGVARNPQAKEVMDKNFWIILAFIEALGIIPIGLGAAMLFG